MKSIGEEMRGHLERRLRISLNRHLWGDVNVQVEWGLGDLLGDSLTLGLRDAVREHLEGLL